MMRRHRLALALSVIAVTVAYEGRARAGGNEAAAEALFVEAKKLAAHGKYAEACPKFAESNKLDRGAGTLIHLANCYEKVKQTASAWATYKEAASAAQALGRKDWEKLANQRANALEPKLAHLTVKVAEPVDKLEVVQDGAAISQASWGVALPVDIGTHNVEATAPGYKEFKTTVTVSKDGETLEVSVPKLEAAAKPDETDKVAEKKPDVVMPPPVVEDGSGQRTLGFIVGGIGLAGIGVGAVTGLMAMGKNNDSKALCPEDGACASQEAVDANDAAKTLGLVSTIAFAAGGVALVAGATLIFTAPSGGKERAAKATLPKKPTVRVAPQAGPATAGLVVLGVF